MGFNNPLTGENGSLIYQQIKSPNFNLAGKTGWAILKDGSAYFFNVTATGVITATEFDGTDFVINTAGEFFYSGTPALNNLILAIANSAGTDPHGNAYPEGLTLWDGTGIKIGNWSTAGQTWYNTQSQGFIQIVPANGTLRSPALSLQSAIPGISSINGSIKANVNGSNPNQYDVASFVGPTTASDTLDSSVDVLLAGAVPPFNGSAAGMLQYSSTNGGGVIAQWDNNGFHIYAGNLIAVQPGTSTPAVGETWHTAALSGNFTTNPAVHSPRYRLEGIGGGVVRIDGTAFVNVATLAANTTIFTLPVGYRPTLGMRFAGVTNLAGYTLGSTLVQVTPAGLVIMGPSGTMGQQVVMDGMTFPID